MLYKTSTLVANRRTLLSRWATRDAGRFSTFSETHRTIDRTAMLGWRGALRTQAPAFARDIARALYDRVVWVDSGRTRKLPVWPQSLGELMDIEWIGWGITNVLVAILFIPVALLVVRYFAGLFAVKAPKIGLFTAYRDDQLGYVIVGWWRRPSSMARRHDAAKSAMGEGSVEEASVQACSAKWGAGGSVTRTAQRLR
jgi:hypothetical protein